MARTVKETDFSTKAKRERLSPRAQPYSRTLDEGLHLLYAKRSKYGKFGIRRYLGEQQYHSELLWLADDNQFADGEHVLSFHQACKKVMERAALARRGNGSTLFVRDAINSY